MLAQVLVGNWVTTYGEVIVRVPPRAFGWRGQEAVGGNISYVVSLTGHHIHTASIMQGASACSHVYISEARRQGEFSCACFPAAKQTVNAPWCRLPRLEAWACLHSMRPCWRLQHLLQSQA